MHRSIQNVRRTFRKHQIRVGRVLAGLGLPEYTILTFFSVLLGISAGFAGVGIHEVIELISHVSFKKVLGGPFPRMLLFVIPVVGMLLQSLMKKLAPKQAAQRGIIEIIKSVGMRNGRMPFRTTLFQFIAPAICIGTGGTVGPEAPAAQSGAGIVATLGRIMGLSESRQRIFTAAGAGAAIAAVFNTPLAGVFFAIEVVLLNDYRVSALSVFLLASVSASAVSRIILGNEPRFIFSPVAIGSYRLFVFYLVMGIGAGLLAVAFIRSHEAIKRSCNEMYQKIPNFVGMALVGLLMGMAGYWVPLIFGVGYDAMNQILANSLSMQTVLILLLLKFFLVLLILGVGGFGGVYAPSLFLGACFGHLFAAGMSHLFGFSLDLTTYTLVGMGAMLAAINSVPLTAIMMLFEMTNDYHFILPLMVGIVGSTLVVQMLLKGSIYGRELQRQGYQYSLGRDTRILKTIRVGDVFRQDILTVPENLTLVELIHNCLDHPHDTIYTVDRHGKLNGVILSSNLRQLITEYQNLKEMVIAKDLAEPGITTLKETDDLDYAMRIFGKRRVEEVPVVSSKASTKILGTLHYQDVLNAYNNARVRLNLTDGLADDMKSIEQNEIQEVLPGLSIFDLEVPKEFVNKTIKELRLRNRFGVDVLMIEKDGDPFDAQTQEVKRVFPSLNYRFKPGDRIIVFGKKEQIESIKEYSNRA